MNIQAPVDIAGTFNLALPAGARAAQQLLRDRGLYHGIIDGEFGPASQTALLTYNAAHADLHESRVFVGTHGYQFSTYIQGDDLCADAVEATCFGAPSDPMDDGTCASGWKQKQHPDAMICSLPMGYSHACQGSPFGQFLGWGTIVQITTAGSGSHPVFDATLEDVGPASWTHNAVDCGEKLARALADNPSHFGVNNFRMLVNVRVLGAVKHLLQA